MDEHAQTTTPPQASTPQPTSVGTATLSRAPRSARDHHPYSSRIRTRDSNERLRPGHNRHSPVTAHPAGRLFPTVRSMIVSPNPEEGEALMLTTFRSAV